MPINIVNLSDLNDNTPVLELSGNVQYVNERKNSQWGIKQSIKLVDDTGSVYITFVKCPPIPDAWKGQYITLKCRMTANGPKGVKKRSYQKDGQTIIAVDVEKEALTFIGALEQNVGSHSAAPQQQMAAQSSTITSAPQPRHLREIPDDELEAMLLRWYKVHHRVVAMNQTMEHPLPTENLGALTTHMVMNFIR